jgi:hypothetical protein
VAWRQTSCRSTGWFSRSQKTAASLRTAGLQTSQVLSNGRKTLQSGNVQYETAISRSALWAPSLAARFTRAYPLRTTVARDLVLRAAAEVSAGRVTSHSGLEEKKGAEEAMAQAVQRQVAQGPESVAGRKIAEELSAKMRKADSGFRSRIVAASAWGSLIITAALAVDRQRPSLN